MVLSSSSNSVPYVVYFPKLYLICPETGLCGKIFFPPNPSVHNYLKCF